MNEIEELKKKWSETRDIIRSLFKACLQKLRGWLVLKKTEPNFLLRLAAAVVVVSLAVGFFVGFAATKTSTLPSGSQMGSAGGDGFSFFGLFGKGKSPFPGAQEDGSFVISNFENPADFNLWDFMSARMLPSTHYAWEGSWSAQVSFFTGKEIGAVTVDDLGRKKNQPSNWTQFGAIQFKVFHPGQKEESLTFLITDLWGKQYEEALTIPPGRWIKLTIPTQKIGGSVNLEKINQISLSRRGTSSQALDFYLDDVRLVPLAYTGGKMGTERGMDYGFAKRRPAWTVVGEQGEGEFVRVPFIVRNETGAFCQLCPVQGGIPFPQGQLHDPAALRIRNVQGEDLPFQSRVLGFWPDRSVKWLDLSFESTLGPNEGTGYFLEYGANIRAFDFTSSLKVAEDEDSIRVSTGVLEVLFDKKSFFLFDRVALDQNANGVFESGEVLTKDASLTLSFRGKEFRTDLNREGYQMTVEEKGSQRVVLRASGWYVSESGERYCQAIVRYYFYQGKSFFRVSHTLIYTGYPENKQYAAYQMLHLPANETIESYSLRLPYPFSQARDEEIMAGVSGGAGVGMGLSENLRLSQKDYESAEMERDGALIPFEDTLSGWMDVSDKTRGMTVSLRHFRENFPKAFRLDRAKGEIVIDLWPKEAGELDLATTPASLGPDDYGRGNAFGLAKTHDLLFYFHNQNAILASAPHVATSFMEPLFVRTNPYWMDATGALGRLYPVDARYGTEEKMLERLFDWAARQPRDFKWYGMLHFGDTLTWMRDQDEDQKYADLDWHPVGRWGWYNCEGVGTHTGALLQFARSGNWKYFEFGENLARHIMDVDTVHYDTVTHDKRLKNIIDPRYSRVGAMHRHSGIHWGGRTDEASHTNVTGLLLYYYLSGEERAFEVAKEVGEYFLSEPFTYIERADVAPNRAMANALWGDTLLYQSTGDERYKKAAEKIVKIFLKGQQQDGSFLENYNPILGTWSGEKHELYMAGYLVNALMTYHELTQDEAVKEAFLRLVRYLAPTEYSGPTILHAIAHAYLLTRDPFFIAMAEENVKRLISHQQFSQDPKIDGLIYEKPIYHRPMAILSTVPYVFGALEEHFTQEELERLAYDTKQR